MKRRFSVEQIVAVLKQAELGLPVADLTREVGRSEQTFYRWKKQSAGLESCQSALKTFQGTASNSFQFGETVSGSGFQGGGQSRPYPRGGLMAASSSRSTSAIAWRASAVAVPWKVSGKASAQATYSAWSAISSATASCHRCGRVRRSAGRL